MVAPLYPYQADSLIRGTYRSETLIGTSKRDWIEGNGGQDELYGLGGDDTLVTFNRRFESGYYYYYLYYLIRSAYPHYLPVYGGSGKDRLINFGGEASLYGEEGNDVFQLDTAATGLVHGGSGIDTLHFRSFAFYEALRDELIKTTEGYVHQEGNFRHYSPLTSEEAQAYLEVITDHINVTLSDHQFVVNGFATTLSSIERFTNHFAVALEVGSYVPYGYDLGYFDKRTRFDSYVSYPISFNATQFSGEVQVQFGTGDDVVQLGSGSFKYVDGHDGNDRIIAGLGVTTSEGESVSDSESTTLDILVGGNGDDTLISNQYGKKVLVGVKAELAEGSTPDKFEFVAEEALNPRYEPELEQDTLVGSYSAQDTFVLGTSEAVFYDDFGDNDHALIRNFSLYQDKICLTRPGLEYFRIGQQVISYPNMSYELDTAPNAVGPATGIYVSHGGLTSESDRDLIAIISGLNPDQLSLGASYFSYDL